MTIYDYHQHKTILEKRDHKDIVSQIIWLQNRPESQSTDSIPPFFSASLDKTIRYYVGGECKAVLTDHKDWLRCLALSPNEEFLFSGCISSVIYKWDVETLKPVWIHPNAHPSTVRIATLFRSSESLLNLLLGVIEIRGTEFYQLLVGSSRKSEYFSIRST